MDAISFCYWLRGFLELAEPSKITAKQIEEINNHLDLVLHKVTPTTSKTLQPNTVPLQFRRTTVPDWVPNAPMQDLRVYVGDIDKEMSIKDGLISFNQEAQCSC